MHDLPRHYRRLEFSDLPGWADDDHEAALAAFAQNNARLEGQNRPSDEQCGVDSSATQALSDLARMASANLRTSPRHGARAFFEKNFTPFALQHAQSEAGLLTGYYEPELIASRHPSKAFPVPLYRRPADLVNIVGENQRASASIPLTHARKTAGQIEPMPTREQIECGALADRKLEFAFLADPVDAFFLHVQGSGLLKFEDGSSIRVSYDGKNGYPYTSIGRYLIETGLIPEEQMTLETLASWLRADGDRARSVMWKNKSFIFFRELDEREHASPLGLNDIPLTPGRSLAVDCSHHTLGMPIFVDASQLTHASSGNEPFRRLMIAQDTGSAIRGPERGDVFFGSGKQAGFLAGRTKHACRFYVLCPKPTSELAG